MMLGSAAATPLLKRDDPFKFYCRVEPNLIGPNDFLKSLPLLAKGNKFYLGDGTGSTSTASAAVFVGSPNACSLDVGVPGGQRVYVGPDLSVGYTSPHSAAEPEGAVECLDVDRSADPFGSPITLWSTALGANGFMACPVDGQWELFAQQWNGPRSYGSRDGCVWIDLDCQYYLDQSEAAVWSY